MKKENVKIELDQKHALARFLDCDIEDIKEDGDTFTIGREEYLVLTDEEAEEKAREYILDNVWAFNKSFLKAILAMIEDKDYFVEDAIECDGRGHFLSGYDGEENEEGEYFIYRIN